MLLAGRALEGAGAGALIVVTYASSSRAYPPEMYGRMLALMSSAWVLPSLAGPAVAGFVADHASWRWVFVFLLPFLPLAMALTLPGLRALPAPGASPAPRRLAAALALATGTGVFLAALELEGTALLVLLAAAGLAIALPALRTLLPAGTLRAARGLPSGVAVRGLLAVGFLGCDAFMPLALTELRGFSSSQAGLVISAASLSWSLGAYLQARRDRADDGAGRPQRARASGWRCCSPGSRSAAPACSTQACRSPSRSAAGWSRGWGSGSATRRSARSSSRRRAAARRAWCRRRCSSRRRSAWRSSPASAAR